MLTIAICDDEDLMLEKIETLIAGLENKIPYKVSLEMFGDGGEILDSVKAGKRYDIIFMDIEMEHMNGIEAAAKIREFDKTVQLIYVTSYDSYMRESFKTIPVGFISKPISEELFEETLFQALKFVGHQDEYLRFLYKKSNYKIEIREILYIQSNLRQVNIVCNGRRFERYCKLVAIEEELKQYQVTFLRIHKSYLVNALHITRFSYDNVCLTNGDILPVSRTYRAGIEDFLNKL